MASKILHHRWHQTHPNPDHPGEYRLAVHLDTSQVDAENAPLPQSVQTFTFGGEPPPGVSEEEYEQQQLEEVKRQVAILLHDQKPMALSSEGHEF